MHHNIENISTAASDKVTTEKEKSSTSCECREATSQHKSDLLYTVHDTPPWYICLPLGFQHFLASFSGIAAMPLLLAPHLCLHEHLQLSRLISTNLLVNGIATVLQAAAGIRLPIVQGGTMSFVVAAIAVLSLPEWKCQPHEVGKHWNESYDQSLQMHLSNNYTSAADVDWKTRINEISGAIMIASISQVLIGASGAAGHLVQYIGPLVIAPVIILIGISIVPMVVDYCATNWPIAALTCFLVILFSQYLADVNLPAISYKKGQGFTRIMVPVFKLYPIMVAMLVSWLVCHMLMVSGLLSADSSHWSHAARTDRKQHVLHQASWFYVPYPGQWGWPTISVAGVCGIMCGVLVGIIESVGDYYACAKLCGARHPPSHAINRGILIEGVGCLLSGIWGSGTGTTSYSQNVAAISITKVGSPRVVIYCGGILILVAMFGKFGALFVMIPEPILGGVFLSLFGMISAVGISNLQYVDLNSSRNIFILGFSLYTGLVIPTWIQANPQTIDTGNATANQLLLVLLSTNMFVAALAAVILDNTVKGTDKERGLHVWKTSDRTTTKCVINSDEVDNYDLPVLMDYIRSHKSIRYLPICPSYTGFRSKRTVAKCCCKRHT